MIRAIIITLALLLGMATATARGLCEMCDSLEQIDCMTLDNKMLRSDHLLMRANTSPLLLHSVGDKLDFIETVNTDYPPSAQKLKEIVKWYLSQQPTFTRTMHIKDDESVVSLYQRQLEDGKYEYMLVVIDESDVTLVNLIGALTPAELGDCTFF